MSNAMPLTLRPVEEEVAFLKAVNESIDSMVNFEMLSLHGSDPDSNLLFVTQTHQRFFNIALVDFLSLTDKRAPVRKQSYLSALQGIATQPNFAVGDSIASLRLATNEFIHWLEQEITIDVWLPSIRIETPIRVPRVQYIKMCGDISKHNLLRSVGVAEDLQRLLALQGTDIELEAAMLALEDFYEWFHDHVLSYHSNTIAEFLNNIRWGIYEYLQPELRRSIVWEGGDPPKYRYTYPAAVVSDFGKECYWNLLNEVRRPPYVRKFAVTKWLKLRY